jgi:hypothetical protein
MTANESLEHLPIGQLQRRADGGDAAAAEALKQLGQSCATLAAGARETVNAHFAKLASARWQFAGTASAAIAASGSIGVPKELADILRVLDQRDELLARRMARLRDRLLGRPGPQRFVSHMPFRGGR